MTAGRLETLGNRIVTARRARAVAAITVALQVVTYSGGLVNRHGLVDGFGHVVGADLLAQRIASRMTRDGYGDRLYDFDLQARYEQAEVSPERLPGLDPFVTPPYVAAAYWPFMLLGQGVAFVVWSAFGIGLLVASVWWLGLEYPWVRGWRATILLLSFSFFPVIEGLMAGSNQMVSLCLLTAVFLSLKRGRDGTAGVLLGVQLFKPQLAIATLAVLLFKRRWKAVIACGVVAILWALVATFVVSRTSLVDYVRVVPALSRLAFAEGFPYYLQSSLYALFMIPMGPSHAGLSTVLGTIASLVVIGLLLREWSGAWAPASDDFERRVAATVVATTLVGQHFLVHDFTITILAAVLLADDHVRRPAEARWGTRRLALAMLWVTCFVGPLVTQRTRVPLVPLAALCVAASCRTMVSAERSVVRVL